LASYVVIDVTDIICITGYCSVFHAFVASDFRMSNNSSALLSDRSEFDSICRQSGRQFKITMIDTVMMEYRIRLAVASRVAALRTRRRRRRRRRRRLQPVGFGALADSLHSTTSRNDRRLTEQPRIAVLSQQR
jgi:hypothetical protein